MYRVAKNTPEGVVWVLFTCLLHYEKNYVTLRRQNYSLRIVVVTEEWYGIHQEKLVIWMLAIGGVALLVVVAGAVIISGDEVEDEEVTAEDRRANRFETLAEAFLRLHEELGREPTPAEIWRAVDSQPDDEEQAVVVDLRDRVAAVAREYDEWRMQNGSRSAPGQM